MRGYQVQRVRAYDEYFLFYLVIIIRERDKYIGILHLGYHAYVKLDLKKL